MQSQRHDAVRPGGADEICHQLGGDGVARLGLAVLPGIAEIGDHGGDAVGGGAAHGVDQDEQFHEIVVHRRAGALHDEAARAAHAFLQGNARLAVAEFAHRAAPGREPQAGADAERHVLAGPGGEDFNILAV